MMKQLLMLLFVLVLVLGFSLQAQAELFNRGTDSLGNRLIYDSDLNITWYDYTNSGEWSTMVHWFDNLAVEFNGTSYSDWRMPLTVDAQSSFGYNITSSEIGHLFYTELGNKGYCDTSGNCHQSGYGLTKTGDFQNLQPNLYWSGTEYAAGNGLAWAFDVQDGFQAFRGKSNGFFALAVRPGDVAVVPEPISSVLFLTGGATLIGRIYLRTKKA